MTVDTNGCCKDKLWLCSTLLSNLVTASDYRNLPRLRRKYDPHKLIFVPLERGEG